MKKTLLSITSLLLILVIALSMLGCNAQKHFVIDGDYVVITVDASKVAENSTLKDYMDYMQQNEEFTFVWESGMLVSIDGRENGASFNPCWMLYTNDTENSNSAWGICEYNGESYSSASLGAETLPIKDGCTYIWYLQAF